jgi:hypothetical protein
MGIFIWERQKFCDPFRHSPRSRASRRQSSSFVAGLFPPAPSAPYQSIVTLVSRKSLQKVKGGWTDSIFPDLYARYHKSVKGVS